MEREREMTREEQVKIFGEEKSSGGAEMISSSNLLSLLASKDRDFLLSPTGTRVISLSLSLDDRVSLEAVTSVCVFHS